MPVSAIKSDLLIQKLKLPSIIAIDVNIKLPVIANNTNNKNTLTENPYINTIITPYNISPIAEAEIVEVIAANKTFFGCTKNASNFPVLIVSDNLYALSKKKCEIPNVAEVNPQRSNTCFSPYPPMLSFNENNIIHCTMKHALLRIIKITFIKKVVLFNISLINAYLTDKKFTFN